MKSVNLVGLRRAFVSKADISKESVEVKHAVIARAVANCCVAANAPAALSFIALTVPPKMSGLAGFLTRYRVGDDVYQEPWLKMVRTHCRAQRVNKGLLL